jgi:hypothetical protein
LTAPELEAFGVICDGDDVSVHASRRSLDSVFDKER